LYHYYSLPELPDYPALLLAAACLYHNVYTIATDPTTARRYS